MLKLKIFALIIALTAVNCSNFQKHKTDMKFTKLASKALKEYRETCERDNSKLWNKSLCVPMIIIDRQTMNVVSTHQSPNGKLKQENTFFFGKYDGPKIYANTSIEWNGKRWSMVMWPVPKDKNDRVELLMHEAWHSVQNDLNLPLNSNFQEHLDQYDGRLLMRLEWSALLEALKNKKDQQRHIANALHFRRLRFNKYPSAKKKENILDLNEGLAAYTGLKFKTEDYSKQLGYLEDKLNKIPKLTSLTRSASYYTGPLYGLLLDHLKPNWKLEASKIQDFGDYLQQSAKVKLSKSRALPSLEVLSVYSYNDINSFEVTRAAANKSKISKYLDRISKKGGLKIKSGPKAMFMFNPNGILVVGENDLIYTSYEVRDSWGTLKVSDGARVKITKNSATIMVSPPQEFDELDIKGESWTLELNPGWTIRKNKGFSSVERTKNY